MFKKLAGILKEAEQLIGKGHGRMPRPLYDFIRRYDPLMSVDAILIPVSKNPSVLMLKRSEGVLAAGQYYSLGGKLGKRKDIIESMRSKIRAETGLSVQVKKNNIIGFGTSWFKANKKNGHDFDVFAPALSFAVRVPIATQLRKKLKIGHGNVGWKIFTQIQPDWDNYLSQAVARAWDLYYGKEWREKLPANLKKKLNKFNDFIPLEYLKKDEID